MNTPVYIITGFLESGKTKFISEMLADDGFSEGERTLLLCCEEGEEEYDSKLLHRTNTVLEPLDEPEDLEKLVELDEKYRPERVIIEYNSTWLLQALYSAKKPESWDLAQIITLVDSTTFEIYLKNMRSFMADGLTEAGETGLLRLVEIAAAWLATELLVRITGTDAQFRMVDFRLMFVVLIGTVYGLNAGVLSAVLASVSLTAGYLRQSTYNYR